MSHFCVLVIGENPEDQLAKYDENLEVPMHLVFTKEQIIKKERDRIEKYKKGLYAEYLVDPEKYKENCHNEAHLKYITEEFPKKLKWTDEQCYEAAIQDYRDYIEEGEKFCEIHEDGSLWMTTNDNAKWDWYQKGGRFRGLLKLKKPNKKAPLYNGWEWNDVSPYEYEQLKNEGFCDQAYVKDVANLNEIVTFAIIKDGEWHERWEMGWWCSVSNEKNQDTWEAEVRSLLADLPGDTLLTVVDCHI